jgi:hypothetical protein
VSNKINGNSIKNTVATTVKPVTVISLPAARLSLAGAAAFLVLLAVLHVIKREFDREVRRELIPKMKAECCCRFEVRPNHYLVSTASALRLRRLL